MSLSPSFPQGAPTLAEVLLQRTFAKPPQPFVDGEFLEALEHADDEPSATVAISRPGAGGQATDPQTGSGASSNPSSAGAELGRTVDVRV